MTDKPKPLTDRELDAIEGSGAWNTLGESTGELILRLVAEVRRLRLAGYEFTGASDLQAQEGRSMISGMLGSGYVQREELRQFEGWTLVTVSGDIPVEGRTSRLRLCFRSPMGEDRNVYVEPHDERDGSLQYYHMPAAR